MVEVRLMKMLSLFAGIGGLDLAAHWAGIETAAFCEINPFCREILAKHWPGVPIFSDVKKLTKETLQDAGVGSVDIVCGGFPCQPFSAAGKRKGTCDDRYLLPEMLRVISEIEPTWVVGENVTGLLSMAEQVSPSEMDLRIFNRTPDEDYYRGVSTRQETMLLVGILEKLEAIGYEVQTFHFPACGVAAPHARYRVFIVARHTDRQHKSALERV